MTTHQTPPQQSPVTRETWQSMVEVCNDSAATDPVDWAETTSPHYQAFGRHRWLWHYAIPMGELEPGVQAITSRSGTALTEAAAQRVIARHISRHFAETDGRDPHGPLLDQVRKVCLGGLALTGFGLFVETLDCSPSLLGIVVMAVAVVGIAATLAKSRRAQARRS